MRVLPLVAIPFVLIFGSAPVAAYCEAGSALEYRAQLGEDWQPAQVLEGPDAQQRCVISVQGHAIGALREQLRPATQAQVTPPTVKLAPEARELPPAKPQQQSPWPW